MCIRDRLRDVISEKLQDEGKNVSIGACVYYQDCALRVDNVKQGVVTKMCIRDRNWALSVQADGRQAGAYNPHGVRDWKRN